MTQLEFFKNYKNKDYNFLDKMCKQYIHLGGTLIFVHKYLGAKDQPEGNETQPGIFDGNETSIQDLLLLENRDRKYSDEVFEIKGTYTVSDLEFNLSQFGIMLAGDTMFITFHLNDMVERLGRKIMSGDVLELLHRRDDLLLDPNAPAINAFYVVTDANRPAEGYGPTWYPHLWRIKAKPLTDSQEFKDIFDKNYADNPGNINSSNPEYNNNTIGDSLSTADKYQNIDDAIAAQNAREVDRRNFDSSHYWIDPNGKNPGDTMLPWIFNGDGVAPNSNNQVPVGKRFPDSASDGEYFLRIDYKPAALFRRVEGRWKIVEEAWRRKYEPQQQKLREFVNDEQTINFTGRQEDTTTERQAVTKAITNKKQIPTPPYNTDGDGNIKE